MPSESCEDGHRRAILKLVRSYKAETARLHSLAAGDDRPSRGLAKVLNECNARLDLILRDQREGRP